MHMSPVIEIYNSEALLTYQMNSFDSIKPIFEKRNNIQSHIAEEEIKMMLTPLLEYVKDEVKLSGTGYLIPGDFQDMMFDLRSDGTKLFACYKWSKPVDPVNPTS